MGFWFKKNRSFHKKKRKKKKKKNKLTSKRKFLTLLRKPSEKALKNAR